MNCCIKNVKMLLVSLACALMFCACQKDYVVSITTLEPTNITESSAVCQGELQCSGSASPKRYGVCWSTQDTPSLSDNVAEGKMSTNNIYSCNLRNLKSSTLYYVRAFVIIEGDTFYGEVMTFTTKVKGMPVVSTKKGYSGTFVNGTGSVTVKGEIVSEGDAPVTERGFLWGTTPDLTVHDSVSESVGGIGIFSGTISNLNSRTIYYYRAYATNSIGTTYGEIESINESYRTITVNGVSFNMIYVGGTFQMGAQSSDISGTNYDELANDDESPVHKVTLYDYHIGETEVTQELWEAIMGTNPSIRKGANLPVENVSWDDVQEFINRLNVALENNHYYGFTFRLPTEAEWEYAARGGGEGETFRYSGSNNIDDVAWYRDNSGTTTHEVKSKMPNAIGIYGMSGNVREWCQDRYGSYPSSAQTNPVGDGDDYDKHVIRGGGWYSDSTACRNTSRDKANSVERSGNLGFRLVH